MKNDNAKFKKEGFSLIEILIVIALMIFLFTLGTSSFSKIKNKQILNKNTTQIESLLQEARSKTLSSVEALRYGVHFEQDKVVLFSGDFFSLSDSNNKDYVLDNVVNISNINLNDGNDVIFNKLIGDTDYFGEITISLISDLSQFKTITILQTGISSLNQ